MIGRDNSALLMIDVQTRLLPHIGNARAVVAANAFLLRTANLFGVPIVATVQYVSGLGNTNPQLQALIDEWGIVPHEKMTFSAMQDAIGRQRISELKRPNVVVTGIESHVCVQQTVLDLIDANLQPVVVRDAVSSRFQFDFETSVSRMAAAGAIITTAESLAFGWCHESGTPEFKALLRLVKQFDAEKPIANAPEAVDAVQ